MSCSVIFYLAIIRKSDLCSFKRTQNSFKELKIQKTKGLFEFYIIRNFNRILIETRGFQLHSFKTSYNHQFFIFLDQIWILLRATVLINSIFNFWRIRHFRNFWLCSWLLVSKASLPSNIKFWEGKETKNATCSKIIVMWSKSIEKLLYCE